MPELTRYEVEVHVRTIVRDDRGGRVLLDVTTSGESKGFSSAGLPAAAAPALAGALAHHSPILSSYRQDDTDAALAKLVNDRRRQPFGPGPAGKSDA